MTNELDLSKFSAKQRTAIALALDLGYRATQSPNKTVNLFSPTHPKRIPLAPSKTNDGKLSAFAKQIIRYGDPVKTEVLRLRYVDGEAISIENTAMAELLVNEADLTKRLVVHAEPPQQKRPTEPKTRVKPTEEVDVAAETVERVVVSVRPRPSRTGGQHEGITEVYDSEAVLERKWSDGSVDYICGWKGCDFDSPNHRAVASHYGASKSHNPVGERHPVLDPNIGPSGLHRDGTMQRVLRLQKELADAMDALKGTDKCDPSKLAEWVILHRPVSNGGEDGGEPLTPEQIIEKIRRLVDSGSYVKAREQAEEAAAKLVAATAEAALIANDRDAAFTRIAELEAKVASQSKRIASYKDVLRSAAEVYTEAE